MTYTVHIVKDEQYDEKIYNELVEKIKKDPTAKLSAHKTPDSVFIFTTHDGFLDQIRKCSPGAFVIGCEAVEKFPTIQDAINSVKSILMEDGKKFIVTSTGLRDGDLDQTKVAVRMLGGNFSNTLSPKETKYVIENRAEKRVSQKHKTAVDLKIPIVQSDWLFHCLWGGTLIDHNEFPLPLFDDIQICVTGIKGEERQWIEEAVNLYGGIFQKQLAKDCGVLIAEEAEGPKFQFAQKHNINVVQVEWLKSCINTLSLQPWSRFEIKKPESPPAAEADPMELASAPGVSILEPIPLERKPSLQFIEETMMGEPLNKEYTYAVVEDPEHNEYLEDCTICLIGVAPEKLHRRAVDLILVGGGTRLDYFHPDAMYIVTTDAVLAKEVCPQESRIVGSKVVSISWLEECYQKKKCLKTGPFELEAGQKRRASLYKKTRDETVGFANFLTTGEGIFGGLTFQLLHLGFEDRKHCESILQENGGVIVNAQKPHYIVTKQIDGIHSCHKHAVSPTWVDECMVTGEIVRLGTRLDHFPEFIAPRERAGFADITVVVGGFKNDEKEKIQRLLKSMGATVDKKLSHTQNLVLLAPFTEGFLKSMQHNDAKKFSVPCVTLLWLIDSITEGTLKPFANYLLSTSSFTPKKKKRNSTDIGTAFAQNLTLGIQNLKKDGAYGTTFHVPKLMFKRPSIPSEPKESFPVPMEVDEPITEAVMENIDNEALERNDEEALHEMHDAPAQATEAMRSPDPPGYLAMQAEDDPLEPEPEPEVEPGEGPEKGNLHRQLELVDNLMPTTSSPEKPKSPDSDAGNDKSEGRGPEKKKSPLRKRTPRKASPVERSVQIKPLSKLDVKRMPSYLFWMPKSMQNQNSYLIMQIEHHGGRIAKSFNKSVTHFVYLKLAKNTKQMKDARNRYSRGKLQFIHLDALSKIIKAARRKKKPEKTTRKRAKQTESISSFDSGSNSTVDAPRKRRSSGSKSVFGQDSSERRGSYSKRKRRLSEEVGDEAPKKKKKTAPECRIGLSSCTGRQHLENMILELNWSILTDKDYHEKVDGKPKMTHLVIGQITQTAKLFVAIVSGVKIVKPDWLHACFQARGFVDEEKYLWSSKEVEDEDSQSLLEAIPRFVNIKQSPFTGKRIFMHDEITSPMNESWRIFQVLGGVVTRGPELPEEPHDFYLFEAPDEDEELDTEVKNMVKKAMTQYGEKKVFDVVLGMEYVSVGKEALEQNLFSQYL